MASETFMSLYASKSSTQFAPRQIPENNSRHFSRSSTSRGVRLRAIRMIISRTAPPMSVLMSTSCAPDMSSIEANTPFEPNMSIATINKM